jgi:hypothetical protein
MRLSAADSNANLERLRKQNEVLMFLKHLVLGAISISAPAIASADWSQAGSVHCEFAIVAPIASLDFKTEANLEILPPVHLLFGGAPKELSSQEVSPEKATEWRRGFFGKK